MDNSDGGITIGKNLDIPDTLPKDIPIVDDANIYQSTNTKNSVAIAYYTEISFDKIIEIYEEYFNSKSFSETPTVTEEREEQFKLKMFEGVKKDTLIKVTVEGSVNSDDNTKVLVTYQQLENDE